MEGLFVNIGSNVYFTEWVYLALSHTHFLPELSPPRKVAIRFQEHSCVVFFAGVRDCDLHNGMRCRGSKDASAGSTLLCRCCTHDGRIAVRSTVGSQSRILEQFLISVCFGTVSIPMAFQFQCARSWQQTARNSMASILTGLNHYVYISRISRTILLRT